MELKRRVDEGHKKWRMQLQDTKRHQEVKRKSYYSSRVSMNQTKINEMSEQIVGLVRQESALLDKIKNTTQIKDNVNMRLTNAMLLQKVPRKERMGLSS